MGGDAHVIGYLAEACTPFYRVILGGGLVGYLLFLLLAGTEFRSMVHSITGRLVTYIKLFNWCGLNYNRACFWAAQDLD